MLNRLLKLYSSSNSNTPIEDFTTEVFASVLELDHDLQKIFVKDLLNLNHEHFQIETQKRYTLSKDINAIIDIVLIKNDVICFIENKVESSEGLLQLDKYAQILDNLSEYKEKHLFYCTKYHDPKEENRHHFKQFKWADIARILKESENPIVKEFYYFLQTNNMTQKDELNTKDLFYLENLKESISFLDSFLERIKPLFAKTFGKYSSPDNSSQMRKHNRYVFIKTNVFGSEKVNEIGVGFKFEGEPQAYIWIWTSPNNSKSSLFNEYLKNSKIEFDWTGKDFCCFNTNLVSFIGQEHSIPKLIKWYEDKFLLLKQFIDETPDLKWKLE